MNERVEWPRVVHGPFPGQTEQFSIAGDTTDQAVSDVGGSCGYSACVILLPPPRRTRRHGLNLALSAALAHGAVPILRATDAWAEDTRVDVMGTASSAREPKPILTLLVAPSV
ncbi:hypothetical protein AB870_24360 (plasmid) [Pandoraea faecigallinarum]|uniref:Uncharacterized protein n=1 Tax=Pandoraea faecigallinarum TaxID=656179 RepID=A0A0H3X0C2_9BURK|nr:hypothetical protein AB870_24360 [Pandoraea faecigallinarum]